MLVVTPNSVIAARYASAIAARGDNGIEVAHLGGAGNIRYGTYADVLVMSFAHAHHYFLANLSVYRRILPSIETLVVCDADMVDASTSLHLGHIIRRILHAFSPLPHLPQIVLTAAPLANPASFSLALTGHALPLVRLPRTRARLDLHLAATTDERHANELRECSQILARLIDNGHTVAFLTAAREQVERVFIDARNRLQSNVAERLQPLRGGYLTDVRDVRRATLAYDPSSSVVTTIASASLVDLQRFDFVLIYGFPASLSELRTTLRQCESTAAHPPAVIIMLRGRPIDQWILQDPPFVSRAHRPHLATLITGEQFVAAHLTAAAYTAPLRLDRDSPWWEPAELRNLVDKELQRLTQSEVLSHQASTFYYRPRSAPDLHFPLFETGGSFLIATDDGEVIGTTDLSRAPTTLYPGARYLHEGESYDVIALDLDGQIAHVKPNVTRRSTYPTVATRFDHEMTFDQRISSSFRVTQGLLTVTEQVLGYEVVTQAGFEEHQLSLPPRSFVAHAVWWDFIERRTANIPPQARLAGLHALAHAISSLLPIVTDASANGVDMALQHATGRGSEDSGHGPSIVLYTNNHASIDITEEIFRHGRELIIAANALLGSCDCEDGCPMCCLVPSCRERTIRLSRRAGVMIVGDHL
jgi:DEAD/DEAH box helicase domain-containing protein